MRVPRYGLTAQSREAAEKRPSTLPAQEQEGPIRDPHHEVPGFVSLLWSILAINTVVGHANPWHLIFATVLICWLLSRKERT